MSVGAITVNEGTQSNILTDTAGTQEIGVVKIDLSAAGTYGSLWDGKVQGGTINLGTVQVSGGTISINELTGTINAGTINVGTINTGTINSGTIDLLKAGTITKLEGGTLAEVTNLVGGTLTRLAQGSITVTTGTINVGTIVGKDANAVAQTGNPVGIGGTDSGGTIRTWGVDASGIGRMKFDTGTISVLPNLPGGSIVQTVGTVNTGTINTGTITAGTINSATITGGTIQILNFGTIALSDGTTKANVMASGVSNGTAAQNAQLVAGGYAEFSGSATAGTTDLIASMDVSAYRYASLQVSNTWVGTINMQFSNDNSNFFTSNYLIRESSSQGHVININTNDIYSTGITARYLRVRMNAFTSGTAQGVLELFNHPGQTRNTTTSVAQSGVWNVTGTVAAGTLAVSAGTITAGTINTGTINAGTINTGTINTGTIRDDGRAARNIVSFGTQIASASAVAATIVGSASVGAGTSLWMQDFSVINPSGSVLVVVGFGTAQQGTNVLYRGVLGTQTAVGIEKPYNKAVNAGMTNQDLVLSLGAAGTVDLSISYFISA